MRDRLIHGYDSVDIDELWKTSLEDIPVLMEQVRRIQADIGQAGGSGIKFAEFPLHKSRKSGIALHDDREATGVSDTRIDLGKRRPLKYEREVAIWGFRPAGTQTSKSAGSL